MGIQDVRRLRKECRFRDAEAQARMVLANAGDDSEKAEALCQLGFALYCQDRLEEAERITGDALSLTQHSFLERARGHALRLYGMLQWLKGKYDEALETSRAARAIAEKLGDEELMYQSGISIGSELVYLGEHLDGIDILTSCARAAESHGDWQQAAVAHSNLGIAFCATGNTQLGIHHHRQAQNIYQRYPNPTHMALCLMNIALACAEEEDYPEALTFNAGALQFLPPGSKPLAEAAIRLNTGQALYWLDRSEEAIPQFEKAIHLFENAGHLAGISEALSYLGASLVRTGRQAEGLDFCRRGLEYSEQVGRKDIKLEARMMTGCAYYYAGDFETAAAHLQAAFEMAQASGIRRIEKRSAHFLQLIQEQSN